MTLLQAHRGVSSEYPENTMVAYEAAIEEGYLQSERGFVMRFLILKPIL